MIWHLIPAETIRHEARIQCICEPNLVTLSNGDMVFVHDGERSIANQLVKELLEHSLNSKI
jgi:hypothetical protein